MVATETTVKAFTVLETEGKQLTNLEHSLVECAKFEVAKNFKQFSSVEFSKIEREDNSDLVNLSFGITLKTYYTIVLNAKDENNEIVTINVYGTLSCYDSNSLLDVTFTFVKLEKENVLIENIQSLKINEYIIERNKENQAKDNKKQVLTNDENTNNEVKTMENQKVMAKVANLYTENTGSRIRNVQIDVESSIIRKAFGVKNGEINKAIQTPKKIENFNRKTVLTDRQITEKYMEYIEFLKWAKATDSNRRYDAEIKLEYFVKGVEFFNKSLAEKLKQIAIN